MLKTYYNDKKLLELCDRLSNIYIRGPAASLGKGTTYLDIKEIAKALKQRLKPEYVMVPIEPTYEMKKAGAYSQTEDSRYDEAENIYKAMITAAETICPPDKEMR